MNAVEMNKWTAIHFAARYGHVDFVKLLIQNGADVNAVEKKSGPHLRNKQGGTS